jgi:hypothetical protein
MELRGRNQSERSLQFQHGHFWDFKSFSKIYMRGTDITEIKQEKLRCWGCAGGPPKFTLKSKPCPKQNNNKEKAVLEVSSHHHRQEFPPTSRGSRRLWQEFSTEFQLRSAGNPYFGVPRILLPGQIFFAQISRNQGIPELSRTQSSLED